MTGKTKSVLLWITTSVAGVLGFVLLMWTPKTGKGVLACVAIFAVLAVIAVVGQFDFNRRALKCVPWPAMEAGLTDHV